MTLRSFSSRERVMATLNHCEADRVPRDLMGNASMILDEAYVRLRDHLGLSPIEPVRKGTSANYYDERILDRFDIDFRRIFLPSNAAYNRIIEKNDGTFTDVWSTCYRRDGIYVTALNHPLSDVQEPEDVQHFPWPAAEKLFETAGLRERAKERFFRTKFALVARNPFSAGFIDRSCQLMGTENFCMSLLLRPDVANSVLSRLFDIYSTVYAHFLDEVGEYVQMVETADDIGTQNNLLISPELYRAFIKPLEKRLYDLIHEKAPRAAVFRHTDGSVFPLIADFIDIGIDVLNPVQTSSQGMDGKRLKATFGEEITFHGAIESVETSAQAIEDEVREKMNIFKNGGGYIFAPCNHIINALPESIIHVFDSAEQFGYY